jgi:hypothetical protein
MSNGTSNTGTGEGVAGTVTEAVPVVSVGSTVGAGVGTGLGVGGSSGSVGGTDALTNAASALASVAQSISQNFSKLNSLTDSLTQAVSKLNTVDTLATQMSSATENMNKLAESFTSQTAASDKAQDAVFNRGEHGFNTDSTTRGNHGFSSEFTQKTAHGFGVETTRTLHESDVETPEAMSFTAGRLAGEFSNESLANARAARIAVETAMANNRTHFDSAVANNRTHFDKAVTDAQSFTNQVQQLAIQALANNVTLANQISSNTVEQNKMVGMSSWRSMDLGVTNTAETSNMVGKGAFRDTDINRTVATDRTWNGGVFTTPSLAVAAESAAATEQWNFSTLAQQLDSLSASLKGLAQIYATPTNTGGATGSSPVPGQAVGMGKTVTAAAP